MFLYISIDNIQKLMVSNLGTFEGGRKGCGPVEGQKLDIGERVSEGSFEK